MLASTATTDKAVLQIAGCRHIIVGVTNRLRSYETIEERNIFIDFSFSSYLVSIQPWTLVALAHHCHEPL